MFKSRKPSKINQIPPGINAQVLSFWVVLPKNPRACLVIMDIFKKPFFSQKCLYLNPLHSEEFEFISSSHPKSKRTSPRHPHNIVAQLRNHACPTFPSKNFGNQSLLLKLRRTLWGSWAQKPICPARLQPPWPSLSSKVHIQTVADQGRNSQETTRGKIKNRETPGD